MKHKKQNSFSPLTPKAETVTVNIEDNNSMTQENPTPKIQQPSQTPSVPAQPTKNLPPTDTPPQAQQKSGPNGELIHNIHKFKPMHLAKIIIIAIIIAIIIGGTFYLKQRTSHHGVVDLEQNEDQKEMLYEEEAITTELTEKEE
ncbi:hypothetical protein ACFL21_02875 [Patescibacteria group bacterium]